ncbi:MAG: hypothetical protein IPJ20_15945 [Flammeovirgaceae bacterium]|nr:hypothetical protein [Flammeovirgaceae bacterium]
MILDARFWILDADATGQGKNLTIHNTFDSGGSLLEADQKVLRSSLPVAIGTSRETF